MAEKLTKAMKTKVDKEVDREVKKLMHDWKNCLQAIRKSDPLSKDNDIVPFWACQRMGRLTWAIKLLGERVQKLENKKG